VANNKQQINIQLIVRVQRGPVIPVQLGPF